MEIINITGDGYFGRYRYAMTLANGLAKPDLIIADEPTTALDVTIQGQILYEMQELTRQTGTALLWITHDLSVVAALASKLAVMYAGQIVEYGPIDDVIDHPSHPYTRGLIGAVPSRNRRGTPLAQIPGGMPSLRDAFDGCRFSPRCERTDQMCKVAPDLCAIGSGHFARCVHPYVELQ